MASPINVVPPSDYASRGPDSPGEGSPRASGEEADPFLTRNTLMHQLASTVPASLGGAGAAANSGSLPSSQKSSGSSAASGYGTLLGSPTVGLRSTPPERRRRQELSPEQIVHVEQESVLPTHSDLGPSNVRLVGSKSSTGPSNHESHPPLPRTSTGSFGPSIQSWELVPPQPPLTSRSSQNSMSASLRGEDPAVLTARRVRMDSTSISPAASQGVPGPSNQRSSWRALGGLAGLARFSWFRGNESPSSNRNSRASFLASNLTDADVESGRALLAEPSEPIATLPSQRLGRNIVPPEERPISTFSTKSTGAASGPSIYHDAHSSLPGTPAEPVPALPPRAAGHRAAAAGVEPEFGGWPGAAVVHADEPSETATSTTNQYQVLDVLDIPAPRGMSPFASTNTSRDSSVHSLSKKDIPYPPGLLQGPTLPTPAVWNQTSGGTPSVGSYAANSSTSLGGADRQSAGITIDILEEVPPMAGQSWRSLSDTNKRTTFGLPNYMQTPDYVSEQASLHSMRSHLSPRSSRSAGSAAASRRDGSGSQSSRRTGSSSSGPSLVHSNSLSSDGRRHGRGHGPRSPTLSVFGTGLHSPTSPRLLNPMIERIASDDGYHSRSTSNSQSHSSRSHGGEQLEPLPEGVAIDGPVRSQTKGEAEQPSNRPTSPVLSPEVVPWATGLDKDWTAT